MYIKSITGPVVFKCLPALPSLYVSLPVRPAPAVICYSPPALKRQCILLFFAILFCLLFILISNNQKSYVKTVQSVINCLK